MGRRSAISTTSGGRRNVVTKLDVVGDRKSDEIGAKRVLNDAFHETLESPDGKECALSYSIDDGPGRVAKDACQNYVGRVLVFPVTANDMTFVEWQSTYESSDELASVISVTRSTPDCLAISRLTSSRFRSGDQECHPLQPYVRSVTRQR